MAIANHSPLSNWRGRCGGQVYRVRAGEQVVAAYQPNVSNPRTDAQLQQRAKMALAGKLSSILTDDMIYGLAQSRTDRRSVLMSSLINKSTATLDPLAPEGERRWMGRIFSSQIELSKGFDYIHADTGVISVEVGPNDDDVTVNTENLQFLNATGNEANRVLIVDIFGRTVSFGDAYVGASMFAMSAATGSLTITGAGVHRLYAIPINNTGDAALGRPHYSNLAEESVDDQEPVQVLGTSTIGVASGNFGRSVFLGEFVLTA